MPSRSRCRLIQRPGPVLAALEEACARTREPAAIRARLDEMSWSLLQATLGAQPRAALVRAAALADQHRGLLDMDQERILAAIQDAAAAVPGLVHRPAPPRGAGAHCASVSGPGRHGWSAPTFTPLGPTGAAGPADFRRSAPNGTAAGNGRVGKEIAASRVATRRRNA